jgi:DNA polymerase/3'-5' exonuclease PolX
MKLTINIDCTPAEARAMLGLPDLAPMQAAMTEELEARMREAVAGLDPEALMKMWAPAGLQGLEQLQKAFWSGLGGQARGGHAKDDPTEESER